MRLATITNWAYGATVVLALVSGTTMLLSSNALERERAAVEQRQNLQEATSEVEEDVLRLTEHARQYVNSGDPSFMVAYRHELRAMASAEQRIRRVGDVGAGPKELATLAEAVRWANTLHDQQAAALAAHQAGREADARQLLFGAEYERELDRVEALIARFQDQLDRRVDLEVREAVEIAQRWKTLSEIVLGLTGLLFLCVLYFVFKQRVLRPVVKLSDVIKRLAAHDYAAEPPTIAQIDEIGDMAQAIAVFRENGLERQRLEAERDADRAKRDLLSRMTQRMQGCDTLLDLQDVIRRFVPEIVPARPGQLFLLDKKRNLVREACRWLEPRHSQDQFPPSDCWALRRGLPHRPTGRAIDVPCEHLDLDAEVPDTLCLPLTAQRETLGLLYFDPVDPGSNLAPTPEVYLTMLAENIGLALGNLRLREALRDMALADPLTGLANRRGLDAALAEQSAIAQRLGKTLSCLMIDVDHFKRFNDVFGHAAGDTVLREVGACMRACVREPELAFRFGGEEFLLLLPGLGPEQALERAEEVRARIGSVRLGLGDGDAISVSIGLACSPQHTPFDRLVQTADAALLRAKRTGRNRVEVAVGRDAGEPERHSA